MCWDDDEPQETDQEEHNRVMAERAAQEAAQAAEAQRQQAAARRAQAKEQALGAARRQARASAEDLADTGLDDDMSDDKKKRKAARGLNQLRIDRASSIGGTPVTGGGLTVGG